MTDDLASPERLARWSDAFREYSRDMDPTSSLQNLTRSWRELSGRAGMISVSVKNLEPGQYRINKMVHKGGVPSPPRYDLSLGFWCWYRVEFVQVEELYLGLLLAGHLLASRVELARRAGESNPNSWEFPNRPKAGRTPVRDYPPPGSLTRVFTPNKWLGWGVVHLLATWLLCRLALFPVTLLWSYQSARGDITMDIHPYVTIVTG